MVNGKTWKRSPGWQPGMTMTIILNSQWNLTPHRFLLLTAELLISQILPFSFLPALSLRSPDCKYQATEKIFCKLLRLNTWSVHSASGTDLTLDGLYDHWKESCSAGDGPAQLLFVRVLELVLYIDCIQCWPGRKGGRGMGVFLDFFVHFLNVLQNCLYLFFVRSTFCYVLYRPKTHVTKMCFPPYFFFFLKSAYLKKKNILSASALTVKQSACMSNSKCLRLDVKEELPLIHIWRVLKCQASAEFTVNSMPLKYSRNKVRANRVFRIKIFVIFMCSCLITQG